MGAKKDIFEEGRVLRKAHALGAGGQHPEGRAQLACEPTTEPARTLGTLSPQSPSPPGPVFVVQWLFDEAQLTVDNVHLTGQPVQEGQWLYIQNLGRELRNTLKDVP